MQELETVQWLSDDELVAQVRNCVREDRRVSAQLLAHLGEIEARGLHRDLGYESMFEYAVRELHMSDSEAGLRLHAARFARKFPDSLEMLRRGELHLTAMKLLAPVLKPDNAELLKMSCLKTKQEIQLLIAKHCPQPDVPDAMRRLPTARPANTSATGLGDATLRSQSARAAVPLPALEIRAAASAATPANTSATCLGDATLPPESERAALPPPAREIRSSASASTPANTSATGRGDTTLPPESERAALPPPALENRAARSASTPATEEVLAGFPASGNRRSISAQEQPTARYAFRLPHTRPIASPCCRSAKGATRFNSPRANACTTC